MKISLNWLKTFVNIDASVQDICTRLTAAGLEVEGVEHTDEYLKHVYVGKITKIEKHKDADTLQVCTVDIATKSVQIITSAKNVFEGAFVPVSLEGASLANGIKIKPTVMRGVSSDGMFCSGEELGIDDNFYPGASIDGILIFDEKDGFTAGQEVADALCLKDTVLDINVTPNRPDWNSVIGIAREISALFEVPLKPLKQTKIKYLNEDINSLVKVQVKSKAKCPRYSLSVIKNVTVGRSPLHMRALLWAVGIKPINTFVDSTNMMLIGYGQPMHAFDLDKLQGKSIVVRDAAEGEVLLGLDGKEHKLDSDMLVIADSKTPVCIAGVIGGPDSGITENTKNVALECAVFDLKSVRVTSKKLGLATDSSARYQKGVDVSCVSIAREQCKQLLSNIGAGQIVEQDIDLFNEKDIADKTVVASVTTISQILGIKVDTKKLCKILSNLGIKNTLDGDKLVCTVPSIRSDIENSNDIAEEYIRTIGYDVYDNIETKLFQNANYTKGSTSPVWDTEFKVKQMFAACGFSEVINYSFAKEDEAKMLLMSDAKQIGIINPISSDLSHMRVSLAGSMLKTIAYNEKRSNDNLMLIESGRAYLAESLPIDKQPQEQNFVAFATSKSQQEFFQLKGLVQNVLALYDVKVKIEPASVPYLHPGISAQFVDMKTRQVVAVWGKVHPQVAKNFDVNANTYYGHFVTDVLAKAGSSKVAVKAISKFPTVERDLAFVADENVSAESLQLIIKKHAGSSYLSSNVFDIYRGERLGQGKKSLAFKIKLSSLEKTLAEQDITLIMTNIMAEAEKKLGAIVRTC